MHICNIFHIYILAYNEQEISTRPFQLVTGRTWTGSAFGGKSLLVLILFDLSQYRLVLLLVLVCASLLSTHTYCVLTS
jgi:hypothetical protein